MDIHKEIENAVEINNAFAFRFVKRLTDEHGISRENAVRSVFVWCLCYGEKILGKACNTDSSHDIFKFEDSFGTGSVLDSSTHLEVLTFLEKLRVEGHFDEESLGRILLTIPKNSFGEFLSSVAKLYPNCSISAKIALNQGMAQRLPRYGLPQTAFLELITDFAQDDIVYYGFLAANMNAKLKKYRSK